MDKEQATKLLSAAKAGEQRWICMEITHYGEYLGWHMSDGNRTHIAGGDGLAQGRLMAAGPELARWGIGLAEKVDHLQTELTAYRTFALSVARLVAPPDAEDVAALHLEAQDLGDLEAHLTQERVDARAEIDRLRAELATVSGARDVLAQTVKEYYDILVSLDVEFAEGDEE